MTLLRSPKPITTAFTTAVLTAAALLTGCSGTDTTDSGDATRPAGSGPAGTLRFGMGFTLDDWDTFNKPNNTFISAVYEQLAELGPEGVSVRPRLATSWKQTAKEITFTLRSGVLFHDGTPFNAAAVKANLERIRDTPNQYSTMMDPVAETVVVDDTHLTLKLKRPSPTIIGQLARTGGYMLSPKTIKDKSFKTRPAGTGPWRLNPGETVQDSKVVLDLFDRYYAKPEVGPKRLEFITVTDDEAGYNALTTGQVDVVSVSPPIKPRAEAAGFKALWYPALRYHFLFFDRKDLFADARVRQAVCSSFDTKSLLEAQYDGLGEVYDQRFDQGQPGHNPAVKAYTRDIPKAKQLLAAAGKSNLTFTFPVFPSTDVMGELMRSQLKDAGITVKIEKMSVPQFFSTFDGGKYPAAYNTSTTENPGPYDYYAYRFATKGIGNPFHASSPELDKLAADGLAATDPAAQDRIWKQMTQTIYDQALDCGFFGRPIVFAWNPKKVDGIEPTRGEPSVFRYREARVLR